MVEKSEDLYHRFENLIAQLFRLEGFGVEEENLGFASRLDLFLRSRTGKTAAVEVKLYRTRTLSISTLRRIAAQLEYERRRMNADHSVLVTSARIWRTQRDTLRAESPGLVFFDFDALTFLTGKYPQLASEFETLVRETLISDEPLEVLDERLDISTDVLNEEPNPDRPELLPAAQIRKGVGYCARMREVEPGRGGARDFEIRVTDAIKYIFANDLTAWSEQQITDHGMSRYDLIARVVSKNDVWKMLREQFRCQYVIFECKNYTDGIRQGEIYTTEKYLFTKALRTVAFVISRTEPHESALAAARGALREHGKLIVNLSISDVCEMLDRKDAEQDYNGYLFERIDQMLMKLER